MPVNRKGYNYDFLEFIYHSKSFVFAFFEIIYSIYEQKWKIVGLVFALSYFVMTGCHVFLFPFTSKFLFRAGNILAILKVYTGYLHGFWPARFRTHRDIDFQILWYSGLPSMQSFGQFQPPTDKFYQKIPPLLMLLEF